MVKEGKNEENSAVFFFFFFPFNLLHIGLPSTKKTLFNYCNLTLLSEAYDFIIKKITSDLNIVCYFRWYK